MTDTADSNGRLLVEMNERLKFLVQRAEEDRGAIKANATDIDVLKIRVAEHEQKLSMWAAGQAFLSMVLAGVATFIGTRN